MARALRTLLTLMTLTAATTASAQLVTIDSEGWKLKGDWMTPDTGGPWPAVLMLNQAAGDRAPFRQLARHLQNRGIASLRLDLRGHGQSTNLGTFLPGEHQRDPLIWESQEDVRAAHDWLRAQSTSRIAVLGASYSGEEAAEAGRRYGFADAYVLLSPGSLSDESVAHMDSSGVPWLYVASKDERFMADITPAVQSVTRSAEILLLPGTTHAAHLLQNHADLAERIAAWLDGKLRATCPFVDQEALITRPDFAPFFEAEGVTGTFVLYDPEEARYLVHNPERACRRYIPASTFKIPNSLIALEYNAVSNADEAVEWDGVERFYSAWNRDHSLRSGYPVSAVWLYQELARRVGATDMRRTLRDFDYGNADISGGIDRFWLDGGLRISAVEQVQFLERLNEGLLPVSSETLDQFRAIAVEWESDRHTLRAKTGWAQLDGDDLGWYVGYVEIPGRTRYFALNIDMQDDADTRARREIARGILAQLNVLPLN